MKFIIDNLPLFGILLLSGGALAWPHLQRRGSKVSLLQATQMINQGKTLVLDVREPAEFAAGHLRDAKNIPLKELPQRLSELEKAKAKNVIVMCQSGVRSPKAASVLNKAGFTSVFSLNGGLAAWQAQGMPIAK
ncbi:MAG TPA: rhodanese-like domain-containing protein [Burkholderiaceae bacterium]|nr:rhodanese-like domain-containing protein [Burkholderiaceae bacterium]